MSSSKVTVFPVPVTRKPVPQDEDPARLRAEVERLRGENTLLRERLAAVEVIALEREETIQDLRRALQMLPSVWAEKLEGKFGAATEEGDQPAGPPPQKASPPPEAAPRPDRSPAAPPAPSAPTAPAPTRDSGPVIDQAEAFFAEIAALRMRLERKRLVAEQEILEQERQWLLADIEWTRKWQRSRGVLARNTDD